MTATGAGCGPPPPPRRRRRLLTARRSRLLRIPPDQRQRDAGVALAEHASADHADAQRPEVARRDAAIAGGRFLPGRRRRPSFDADVEAGAATAVWYEVRGRDGAHDRQRREPLEQRRAELMLAGGGRVAR